MERQRVTRIAEGRLLQWAKVVVSSSCNAVKSLGFSVVRLEVLVRNRPIPNRAGDAFSIMPARIKILLTWPAQSSAVKACPSAQNTPHVKPLDRTVDVDIAVIIRPLIDKRRPFVERRAGR